MLEKFRKFSSLAQSKVLGAMANVKMHELHLIDFCKGVCLSDPLLL